MGLHVRPSINNGHGRLFAGDCSRFGLLLLPSPIEVSLSTANIQFTGVTDYQARLYMGMLYGRSLNKRSTSL
jgi:hypothetical protein